MVSNERVVYYGSDEFKQLVRNGYKAQHFELVRVNEEGGSCYFVLMIPANAWATGAWLRQRDK